MCESNSLCVCSNSGQTKDVKIYRLVTSRSFEQEMFDRASRKLGLEQAVLGTFEQGNEDDKPSHEEMEYLLKKGAYALLDEEHDAVTNEFCTDDIDAILKKRTRTRVVEGAKTSSWLNKAGMVVSKSKFTTEDGEQLDMDDPLFWQKVMPDFLTPAILLQKLDELSEEVEGTVKGKGRGRGRWKKKAEPTPDQPGETSTSTDVAETEPSLQLEAPVPVDDPVVGNGEKEVDGDDQLVKALMTDEVLDEFTDIDDEAVSNRKVELSRGNIKKIQKFVTDLKSMMETILDDAEEDALSNQDKDICQRLLFTVSVKEKMFNEEQRRVARMYLKRLEGDRKRRCRTSEATRFAPGSEEAGRTGASIPQHLMFKEKKRRRRRKRDANGELMELEDLVEPEQKKKTRPSVGGAYVGEDGYLHHSDSEDDWSDVGDDPYSVAAAKRERITRKEARRRRQWAQDDDAITAAGRPWPVFPRHLVKDVLSTVIDEVLKYDDENGGSIFSVPVPKDEFPEYYEQIKHPMDYGTMKKKLENGEYRSAQAMQKDFILILQNCREFNSTSSDIVKEARKQHLMRPKILKDASEKHNLFLAEDGSVLEIFDEEPKASTKGKKGKAGDDDGQKAQKVRKKSMVV